jgi:hypothetical protein
MVAASALEIVNMAAAMPQASKVFWLIMNVPIEI